MTKKQVFLPSYTAKHPCIVKSAVSNQHAYCKVCKKDILINSSGIYDVNKHVLTTAHTKKADPGQANNLLAMGFGATFDDAKKATIRQECLMACFIIEHNLPIQLSDHFSMLIKVMCPRDAKDFACKRTKTTFIIKEISADC